MRFASEGGLSEEDVKYLEEAYVSKVGGFGY